MKYLGNISLDGNEALYLYKLLKEKYIALHNQRPILIRQKFDLIKKIVLSHRTIIKGDQPAFFGLVTQTVNKYVEKNKQRYKEMTEIDDTISHNEFTMENILSVIINKIKTEFEFKFTDKLDYTPIENTSEYKHIRKYSLMGSDLPEDFKDEDYINIISQYSPFRFR